MSLVKGRPFDYKGAINVEECKSSKEVMEKAGLNWTVEKTEVFASLPVETELGQSTELVKVPNAFANYRTDCNIPLGLVKEKYTPVQNIEAFSFFDDAIGKDKAIFQTAGFFGNGERIFVSAKLPQNILVNGDPVENYLVFTNSHDGSTGVKVLFTPIRVICENTLNAAIRNATNFVSFRHTKSVHDNIQIAKEILGICEKKIGFLQEQFGEMNKIKMKDAQAEEAFAKVVLTEAEIANIKLMGYTVNQIVNRQWQAISNSGISTQKVNILSGMNDYYHTGVGQKEIEGTAWGVYNAVTGYYSNMDNNEGSKRMDTLLYGDRANKIQNAGNILLTQYATIN